MDYALFGTEDGRGIPAFPGKEWDEELPNISREKLTRARKGFWESRTTGEQQMWQCLKMACEVEDAETARQICSSAGLSRWAREKASDIFCFDELGNRYDVPMFCMCEPRNLVEGPIESDDVALHEADQHKDGVNDEDEVMMGLSVRMTNRQKDIKLRAEASLSILELKEVLEEETKVPVADMRVLYMGGILQNHLTLASAKVKDNGIMQVFVKGS